MTQIYEVRPTQRIMLAHAVFSIANTAVVSLANSIGDATGAYFSVTVADLRWTADGQTDPSTVVGQYLPKNTKAEIVIDNDPDALRNMRFIAIEAGTAVLHAQFFMNR